MLRISALAAAFIAMAGAAEAHPHIFMDSDLRLVRDAEERFAVLEVIWTYDAFYSLSLTTDMGLDADGDGVMSSEDMAALQSVDAQWAPGFVGDTYVTVDGQDIGLSPPRDHLVRYEDGRIISRFLRDLVQPADPAQVITLRNFDPGYYSEYSVRHAEAEGCQAEILPPDLTAADQAMQAELAKLAIGQDAEAEFPAVGGLFAQQVRVTCAD